MGLGTVLSVAAIVLVFVPASGQETVQPVNRSFIACALPEKDPTGFSTRASGTGSLSSRRPPLRMTYLANEGVMLESPLGRVLIDALFGDGLQGYHRVEPPLRDSLERAAGEFGGRAVVLATHAHRDHFDADAIVRYLASNPQATAILPADVLARTLSAGGAAPPQRLVEAGAPERSVRDHDLGWVHVRALGMPHGPTSNRVDHSSYLVTLDGWTALHIGDTQMPPSEWHAFELPAGGIDVALIPYWYLINETYASQLLEAVKPRRIVALHAPLPGAEGAALRSRGGWAAVMREVVARYPQVEVPSRSGETLAAPRQRVSPRPPWP